LSGCGYIDFKTNSVSIDEKIGGSAVFGKSWGLTDYEHRRSLRVLDQSYLLVLWKRAADEQDMARLLVLIRRGESLDDDSPVLKGLLCCDFIQRSTKGVFANDSNDEWVRRVPKRILGPFYVAAETVEEYGLYRVLVGDTARWLSLLGPCGH